MRALPFAILALLLAACTADRTAILVEVTSADLNAPEDVDELRFEAVSEHGGRIDSRHAIQETWPHSLTIVPPENERMGSLTITVTGLKAGEPVVRRVVGTSFQRDATRRVIVTFTRDCLGVICEEGVDCTAGRCAGGGEADAGMPDAGSDAGVTDAGDVDAGTIDASVDDGGVDGGATDAGHDGGSIDAGMAVPCTSAACIGLVVISEVSPQGPPGANAGSDELVELYNRSEMPVDVGGLVVRYASASGSVSDRIVIPTGTVILPHGYLLMASANYTGTVAPDVTMRWGQGLATSGSILLTLADRATRIDALGWRTGTTAVTEAEGAAVTITSATLSIERRARGTSTTESMSAGGEDELAGNGYDTGDNTSDFVVRTVRDPQNAASPREP
ncbi:fibronectin type III domain protein [Sandaracinus amylolyticus]|uniref:Fibronectin type III domain protein n=2 Tax=Sandaracinus amylolyticus TaxID=927083 RepID=A0A0F6W3M0_9BACT|nr:fibronectin type III domain protein [Sandaracinus amylolyticus]